MNHEKKEVYLIYWVINYKDIYIYVCVCVNSNIMLENRYRIGRERYREGKRGHTLLLSRIDAKP